MNKILLTYAKAYVIIVLVEGITMTNVNITNFRKDIYKLLEQTIKYNEPLNISTKNGNAIVLSEDDYNSLIETLYIESIPNLKKELLERKNSSDEDFINEDKVEW